MWLSSLVLHQQMNQFLISRPYVSHNVPTLSYVFLFVVQCISEIDKIKKNCGLSSDLNFFGRRLHNYYNSIFRLNKLVSTVNWLFFVFRFLIFFWFSINSRARYFILHVWAFGVLRDVNDIYIVFNNDNNQQPIIFTLHKSRIDLTQNMQLKLFFTTLHRVMFCTMPGD